MTWLFLTLGSLVALRRQYGMRIAADDIGVGERTPTRSKKSASDESERTPLVADAPSADESEASASEQKRKTKKAKKSKKSKKTKRDR